MAGPIDISESSSLEPIIRLTARRLGSFSTGIVYNFIDGWDDNLPGEINWSRFITISHFIQRLENITVGEEEVAFGLSDVKIIEFAMQGVFAAIDLGTLVEDTFDECIEAFVPMTILFEAVRNKLDYEETLIFLKSLADYTQHRITSLKLENILLNNRINEDMELLLVALEDSFLIPKNTFEEGIVRAIEGLRNGIDNIIDNIHLIWGEWEC